MTTLIPIGRKSAKEDPRASRERQEGVIATWAKQHPEIKLAPMVWENAVSGSSDWRERGLGEALERCARGEAAGIIVENQDRLSREKMVKTAEVWDALQQHGLRLVCVNDGIDTATGDHEMLFTIKAAIARDVAKNMARRTDAMKRSKIADGVYISGTVPFGYDRDPVTKKLVPNGHARIVRELFARRADKQSYALLIGWLNELIPGGLNGKGWSKQTVKGILKNRAYLGEARQGDYENDEAHEAIVERDVFRAVNIVTRRNEPNVYTRNSAALLAGYVRCACCGYAMSRSWSGGRWVYRHRVGSDCPAPSSIVMDNLDEHVTRVMFERSLDRGDLKPERSSEESDTLLVRRDELEVELARYRGNAELLRAVGPEAVVANVNAITAEINELDEELRRLSGGCYLPDIIKARDAWATLTVEERREVVDSLVHDVLVSRAPRGTRLGARVTLELIDGTIVGRRILIPPRPLRRRDDLVADASLLAA